MPGVPVAGGAEVRTPRTQQTHVARWREPVRGAPRALLGPTTVRFLSSDHKVWYKKCKKMSLRFFGGVKITV